MTYGGVDRKSEPATLATPIQNTKEDESGEASETLVFAAPRNESGFLKTDAEAWRKADLEKEKIGRKIRPEMSTIHKPQTTVCRHKG